MILAAGVLLPQVFHLLGGAQAGGMFLPMHFPVIIGGFFLGPVYGLLLGVLTPGAQLSADRHAAGRQARFYGA